MSILPAPAAAGQLSFEALGPSRTTNTIEIHGIAANELNPAHWRDNTLHWVEDARSPLLNPKEDAPFRNIYAPSAVENPNGGWYVYYGGWDGIHQGNDHIYFTTTSDFQDFGARHVLIEPGPFQHICNVNAIADDDGNTSLVCTVYPDKQERNKPALFSATVDMLNQQPVQPMVASHDDIVTMTRYAKYTDADINGMNVLLRDGDKAHLYFGNFRDFGKVRRATSTDGITWRHDGVSVEGRLMVNDVKKFQTADGSFYLMGLHRNSEDLQFAISSDGMTFDEPRVLFPASSDHERYIVALGWVVQGHQEQPARRLLGVLYGAGAVPSLDKNRIFARWLQKKLVFQNSPDALDIKAHGPDVQFITPPAAENLNGNLTLFTEDGITTLATGTARLQPGTAYKVIVGELP